MFEANVTRVRLNSDFDGRRFAFTNLFVQIAVTEICQMSGGSASAEREDQFDAPPYIDNEPGKEGSRPAVHDR